MMKVTNRFNINFGAVIPAQFKVDGGDALNSKEITSAFRSFTGQKPLKDEFIRITQTSPHSCLRHVSKDGQHFILTGKDANTLSDLTAGDYRGSAYNGKSSRELGQEYHQRIKQILNSQPYSKMRVLIKAHKDKNGSVKTDTFMISNYPEVNNNCARVNNAQEYQFPPQDQQQLQLFG